MSLRWMTMVVVVAAAGCGGGRIGDGQEDGGVGTPPDASAGADGQTDSGLRDGGRLGDGGLALPRGEGVEMLDVGDRIREVYLLVPDDWSPGGPCVVALHGNNSSPRELLQWSELDRLARQEGIAVGALYAIPGHADGFDWDRETFLSDGNIDGEAVLTTRDRLVAGGCSASRMYLIGHQFGGMLAFRVAMEASMQFTAVHLSSAVRPTGMGLVAMATRPIPVQILIGEDDDLFGEAQATRDELLADDRYSAEPDRVDFVAVPGADCCDPPPLEGRIDEVWTWLRTWTL